MSEITSGVRHLLAIPFIYNLFQDIVGANDWRRNAIDRILKFSNGTSNHDLKVLDIGCGTGDILSYIPSNVEYVGFDRNPAYIARARLRYRNRYGSKFVCDELTTGCMSMEYRFDLILALGVLHHLDDEVAKSLFLLSKSCLNPGGVLFTLDPVYALGQSKIARFIISKDRGLNVRTEIGYRTLAMDSFDQVECQLEHDPLRIPYTGLAMKCSLQGRSV